MDWFGGGDTKILHQAESVGGAGGGVLQGTLRESGVVPDRGGADFQPPQSFCLGLALCVCKSFR